MKTIEDRLYELLEQADRQQKAVKTAVDAFGEGQKAFLSERTLVRLARDDLSQHLREAVADAATVALAGAVKDTTTLLREEVHTLRVSVNRLGAELGKADEQVKHMLRWTGSRFAGAGMAIVLALVVLGASAGAGMLAWNSRLIDKALGQKQALNADSDECGHAFQSMVATDSNPRRSGIPMIPAGVVIDVVMGSGGSPGVKHDRPGGLLSQ